MNTSKLKEHIKGGKLDDIFKKLYGNCNVYERFLEIIDGYNENFGDNENLMIFSAPGRTEIGGNHTDHQHGRVLAGSVNLDVIACVAPNSDNVIRVFSKGHKPCEINLECLEAIKSEEGSSPALIRGIAAKMSELGHKISGFNAYTTTKVLSGSGLSSSAAFEVLIGEIMNNLFCQNKISAIEIAQISQYAENVYFGKPCGLLDQTACAVGGFLSVDFKNPATPIVTKMDFNLKEQGYKLCIINTKADHADLTDEYAAVPAEMKSVAKFFGKEFLRDINEDEFFAKIADVREKVSDRAVLRAIHFFGDNNRVLDEIDALNKNDIDKFLKLICESGNSSYKYLQNVFASSDPHHQAVSIALAISEKELGNNGVCRVHGGGFAGTIQAFVKEEAVTQYAKAMQNIFGDDAVYILDIRSCGGIKIC